MFIILSNFLSLAHSSSSSHCLASRAFYFSTFITSVQSILFFFHFKVFFCGTSLPLTSTRGAWSTNKLCTVHSLSSALLINLGKIWVFLLKKTWERKESNLGLLCEKQDCYPLCYVAPPFLSLCHPLFIENAVEGWSKSWSFYCCFDVCLRFSLKRIISEFLFEVGAAAVDVDVDDKGGILALLWSYQ